MVELAGGKKPNEIDGPGVCRRLRGESPNTPDANELSPRTAATGGSSSSLSDPRALREDTRWKYISCPSRVSIRDDIKSRREAPTAMDYFRSWEAAARPTLKPAASVRRYY